MELGGRVLTSTAPPVLRPAVARRVGLLRQDPGLFPHLSCGTTSATRRAATRPAASWHRWPGRSESPACCRRCPPGCPAARPHRVALGRLLLAHCDALLLDEPYTGLDASLRRTLTELVAGLVDDRSVPAMLVAHELAEAQAFADRLAVIDRGLLLQSGAPDEVVLRPASRRVAELVGYLGFVPAGQQDGAVIGVHPERVTGGAHPGRGVVLTGTVTACRPAGAGLGGRPGHRRHRGHLPAARAPRGGRRPARGHRRGPAVVRARRCGDGCAAAGRLSPPPGTANSGQAGR